MKTLFTFNTVCYIELVAMRIADDATIVTFIYQKKRKKNETLWPLLKLFYFSPHSSQATW